MVLNITFDNFDMKISKGICFLKITSEYCGPCKAYAPVYEQFARENPDVKCFSVDAFDEPKISARFNVKSVPTTIVFDCGEEIMRFGGAKSLEELKEIKRKTV